MREAYGKEPFNFRLTALRLCKNLPWLILGTVIATVLFGGIYCVKNIVFRPQKTYSAMSLYKLDFTLEAWGQYGTYINETTWETWMHTDEFVGNVQKHLQESGTGLAAGMNKEDLSHAITARVDSDLRMPSTHVTTTDPALSNEIAKAVEQAMTIEFLNGITQDISAIRVVDFEEASEDPWDVRPVRAFLLAAVLSGLFLFAGYLLWELSNDGIYLPETIYRRYGCKVLGTLESAGCKENMQYLFAEEAPICVCPAEEDMNPEEVIAALQKAGCESITDADGDKKYTFTALPAPTLVPEVCEKLRNNRNVLLVARAGAGAAKHLEYVLALFAAQDVQVAAVLLWEADEKLIRNYYRLNLERKPQ